MRLCRGARIHGERDALLHVLFPLPIKRQTSYIKNIFMDPFSYLSVHYYSNHRAFFVLFALFIRVDVADSLLTGLPHFLALGPSYFISSVLVFAGLAIGAISRSERYHECYAIIFLVQITVISFTVFRILI
jgi:hypothetical protein